MKKIILSVLCAFIGFSAMAQYTVGEVVEIDGMQTIVFHSDDEHTYAITLLDANASGGFKQLRQDIKAKKYIPFTDQKYISDIAAGIGEYGKENMQVIVDYCTENNLNINECFPLFAWAYNLGDNWFIPGDAELELLARFLGAGIGRDNYRSGEGKKTFMTINKTLPKKMSLHMFIRSSSLSKGSDGYNNNCVYYVYGGGGAGPKNYWDMTTSVASDKVAYTQLIENFMAYPIAPVAVVEL